MKQRLSLRLRWPFGLLAALGVFVLSVSHLPSGPQKALLTEGEVVLPPAVQWVIYGGDPYLAANMESARVLVSEGLDSQENLDFFVRLYRAIADLNSCHEDGMYLAAAFLPSGGAVKPAMEILDREARCRFWDPWASFHFGANLFFFAHDPGAAVTALQAAADRSRGDSNERFFQSVAIAVKARSFDDVGAAIQYLKAEQKRTHDQGLKLGLEKRIGRLQGLAVLRDAQKRFEERYRHRLDDPAALIQTGVIKGFPMDPLGLGYEFVDGRFELKELGGVARGKP